MMEAVQGSRCPRCLRVVAPPARFCPDHPVAMEAVELQGYGDVVAFTTLHSPPAGFRSPLHIALVELPSGARIFCHGSETRRLRVGRRVVVEAVDHVFYFSHLGMTERVRLFWRRAGDRSERVTAIVKSVVKRLFTGSHHEGSGEG
ncbi:MAG: OB-fold domain-containing protein [Candidatus Rokubacteria bacterium]|nr:OB-fold domain-containing protein [Candidatus Rokubacteria bacterium]